MLLRILHGRNRHTPSIRRLILFSLLILMLFSSIIAYQAKQSYEAILAQGESNVVQITQSLANHVELSFRNADLSIKRAIERIYFNNLFGKKLGEDIENNFRLWLADMPQAAAMYMTDENGHIVLSAHKEGFANIFSENASVANTPFYKETSQGSDLELYAGYVFQNSAPYILLARKYMNIDGSFGGLVFTLINPAYFLTFFHSIETSDQSDMTLLQLDGAALVADEVSPGFVQIVGDYLGNGREIVPGVVGTARIDIGGHSKLLSYVRLWDLPAIVVTSLDEVDYLSSWRRDRIKDISFLALFTIFGSVLSFFAVTMAAQIRRVEESESAAVLASQAKSEFLANVSHELRTPLNAIIGFSEMLDTGYFGDLNAKQRERIRDINLCGTHLLQLINDILDFSKGEAGKMELEEETFELSEIIDECVRIMRDRCNSLEIKLEARVDDGLPLLYADKRKIRQLLLNLLSNAVKFTPKKGRVSITAIRDFGGGLTLAVEDTGIGIAEEDIPKALSVFGQVHRNNDHQGTGLGLPLCRMFAELHGGHLHLESEVDVGTTVYITLPANRLVSDNHKDRLAAS